MVPPAPEPPRSVHDYLVLPEDVDLTNCDREAIHIPGAVQPHGVLLGADDAGQVVIASDNAATLLGGGHPQGRHVLDVIHDARTPGLREWLDKAGTNRRLQAVLTRDGVPMDAIAHRMQGLSLIELEPTEGSDANRGLVDEINEASIALMDVRSVVEAQQTAAQVVRRITGFRRVMVYMFDDDGHGQVVAEDLAADTESFLGLHYPASDIPLQARQLYVRNWTRLIVDSAAEPSRLVPELVPGSDEPLNLAMSQLRAVSPIHLEYLRNMGVASSFSLSLVHEKQLVGLIACHDDHPRHVPFAVRSACEVLARLLSERLTRALTSEREEMERERQRVQLTALRTFALAPSTAVALAGLADTTMAMMRADGFLGRQADQSHQRGRVPLDADAIRSLLAAHPGEGVVATENLEELGASGGVLVTRTAQEGGDGFLAWFRAPMARTVTWGGDPTEARKATGDLTPRASFEAWSETVRDRCPPWEAPEHALAAGLHHALATTTKPGGGPDPDAWDVVEGLTDYIRQLEESHGELHRAATEREEMLAAVAHDLRSPLQTISGFVHLLTRQVGEVEDPLVQEASDRIVRGVARMSELLDGLQRWSRLGKTITPTPVDLRQTLDTVLESLRALLDQTGAAVDVGTLPTVSGDPLLLRQLFQNLVENAVKYRHPNRPPHVVVSAETGPDTAMITVADNGIGIDPRALEDIFRLYQQLRPGHDQGIGLGLALVARITERHGGKVWAESTPDVGTAFHVRLPTTEA